MARLSHKELVIFFVLWNTIAWVIPGVAYIYLWYILRYKQHGNYNRQLPTKAKSPTPVESVRTGLLSDQAARGKPCMVDKGIHEL